MTSPIRPPSASNGPTGDHLPGLDGLRAIAIGTVFGFHLGLPGMSLGWVGVQLFFVISGFLITGILLRSRERPFYFRNFYVRRTLRIFPIYYVLIALYFVTAGVQGDWATVKLLPYYLTYTQSYPQLATRYVCAPMLGHTWTLAIEEQFYLLWPLAIYLVRGRRLFVALAAFLAIAVGSAPRLARPSQRLSLGGVVAGTDRPARQWRRHRRVGGVAPRERGCGGSDTCLPAWGACSPPPSWCPPGLPCSGRPSSGFGCPWVRTSPPRRRSCLPAW